MLLNQKLKRSANGHRLLVNMMLVVLLLCISGYVYGQTEVKLENDKLRLQWENTPEGYVLTEVVINPKSEEAVVLASPDGRYTNLYSANEPDTTVDAGLMGQIKGEVFDSYKYILSRWVGNFRPVPLNTAGKAISFYPSVAKSTAGGVEFIHQADQFETHINWGLDRIHPSDVMVEIRVKAKKDGYFSIATPTIYTAEPQDLEWGMLPGYFQGREIQPDLLRSYAYGQGIPHLPVVVRERTASTLSPLIQNTQGITLAAIPEPGVAADPWAENKDSRPTWQLGLSLMNRDGQLSPTLYHPVLGEEGSFLRAGEERVFKFRFSVQQADWFDTYKHAIYDIYDFGKALDLKATRQSLSNRIHSMLRYLKDDSTSMWQVHEYQGLNIGAQSYLSGVTGADNDAMKNADYGAMWMLARATGDPVLNETRLRPARDFKLTQQQTADGFFKGAATGQYYLWKSRRFTEEWGDYVEPIGVTYYTMLDIGNILLFEPDDRELKEGLRSGADRLLAWQKNDGSWAVAYDRKTENPVFTDQEDLRPTFYGLLVAYKLLGDKKYLNGAVKGADWYVKNGVEKGHFLGVCGDVRFVPDFATVQSSQALLDLHDVTSDKRYLEAAIEAAKLYTASIYTHPVVSRKQKTVKGRPVEDWELTQVGLGFEHGGTLGSANGGGPILLASHAGLFVRIAGLTGEGLFLDMARAAAWGRDAFVNQENSVASYYWNRMDNGPGPFPHHAWWQVGWITDYLMAEISARSNGRIDFPSGFITPKVGPHQPYGFAPGEIFGEPANFWLPGHSVELNNEQVDLLAAKSVDGQDTYLMLLNNSTKRQQTDLKMAPSYTGADAKVIDESGALIEQVKLEKGISSITLPPLSLRVVKLKAVSNQ